MPKAIAQKEMQKSKATTLQATSSAGQLPTDLTKGLVTPEQYEEELNKLFRYNDNVETYNVNKKAVMRRLNGKFTEELKGKNGSEYSAIVGAQASEVLKELKEKGFERPVNDSQAVKFTNAILKATKPFQGKKVGTRRSTCMSLKDYHRIYEQLKKFSRDKQAAEKAKRYAESTKQHEATKRAFDRAVRREDHAELMRRFHEAEIKQKIEAKLTGKPAPDFVTLEF